MSKKKSFTRRNFLLATLSSIISLLMPKSILANTKPKWHLADGSFRNNYIEPVARSFADLRKAFRNPRPPKISFPLASNDIPKLQSNKTQNSVTWIGHATVLVQNNGVNIITDPHFTNRASPFAFMGPERTTKIGVEVNDLPKIDYVFISHNHYDHLDYASLKLLKVHSPNAHYLIPLKLKRWFNRAGIENLSELDWWEEVSNNNVKFTAVPTQHWSNRNMLDRNKTLWCGWVYESSNFKYIFIGDTGYSNDFKDIQEKFKEFDLAAIPIGAYNPRWFMKDHHQNPEEAVQCMLDLNAKLAVATHWGTFQLTLEEMDEPPKRLAAALTAKNLAADKFIALQHGETKYF